MVNVSDDGDVAYISSFHNGGRVLEKQVLVKVLLMKKSHYISDSISGAEGEI